ncbi:MAG: hypothetical protein KC492_28195 [Myxococcales bacterium]|nr:hypothetical protein [Myxococcales bacterium]
MSRFYRTRFKARDPWHRWSARTAEALFAPLLELIRENRPSFRTEVEAVRALHVSFRAEAALHRMGRHFPNAYWNSLQNRLNTR